jgi:two-component system OmpR family response regulator
MTTDKKTILIVDDEPDIREPLCEHLELNGFNTLGAESAEQAYALLGAEKVDLIVLDVMMPGESGLDMCRNLSASNSVPIMLLTALTGDTDRIVGLELGADDYLGKPFNPRELIARIRSVLRRTGYSAEQSNPSISRFGQWRLNHDLGELLGDDDTIVMLSTGEFKLLKALVATPNKILSRDDLISLTQGRDSFPYERSIDNMISRLRRKIEPDISKPIYIQTVWGGGYKFNPNTSA